MKVAIVVLALVLGASGRVTPGPWGGEGAQLVVTGRGASLELDCGRGELTEPLALDREHRFSVKGTFTREGGPTRRDGSNERPVVYSGHLDRDVLELSAREDGAEEPLGKWTFKRGQKVRLRKCR